MDNEYEMNNSVLLLVAYRLDAAQRGTLQLVNAYIAEVISLNQ